MMVGGRDGRASTEQKGFLKGGVLSNSRQEDIPLCYRRSYEEPFLGQPVTGSEGVCRVSASCDAACDALFEMASRKVNGARSLHFGPVEQARRLNIKKKGDHNDNDDDKTKMTSIRTMTTNKTTKKNHCHDWDGLEKNYGTIV